MSEPHPILTAFQASGAPLAMTDSISGLLKGEILGMDPVAGTAVLAFEPDERFKQGGGIIHGGIVSTMLDSARPCPAGISPRRGWTAWAHG